MAHPRPSVYRLERPFKDASDIKMLPYIGEV